jgi:hypothetical protein
MLHKIFNGVCDYKYEDILVGLNFLTLHLRSRHLDALYLINGFKGKINCSSVLDTVGLLVPTRSIRDYFIFTVNRNFKVSPSARCISAVSAVCRSIDIFNKIVFCLLMLVSFLSQNNFLFSCISFAFLIMYYFVFFYFSVCL